MTAAWPQRGVYKVGQYTWFVPSKSDEGGYRRVEWHHHPKTGIVFTCTCPAGQTRGQMGPAVADPEKGHERPCRHVELALAAERDFDRANAAPRPEGRQNLAAFYE